MLEELQECAQCRVANQAGAADTVREEQATPEDELPELTVGTSVRVQGGSTHGELAVVRAVGVLGYQLQLSFGLSFWYLANEVQRGRLRHRPPSPPGAPQHRGAHPGCAGEDDGDRGRDDY